MPSSGREFVVPFSIVLPLTRYVPEKSGRALAGAVAAGALLTSGTVFWAEPRPQAGKESKVTIQLEAARVWAVMADLLSHPSAVILRS